MKKLNWVSLTDTDTDALMARAISTTEMYTDTGDWKLISILPTKYAKSQTGHTRRLISVQIILEATRET